MDFWNKNPLTAVCKSFKFSTIGNINEVLHWKLHDASGLSNKIKVDPLGTKVKIGSLSDRWWQVTKTIRRKWRWFEFKTSIKWPAIQGYFCGCYRMFAYNRMFGYWIIQKWRHNRDGLKQNCGSIDEIRKVEQKTKLWKNNGTWRE